MNDPRGEALAPGAIFVTTAPFVRYETEIPDVDGMCRIKGWRPGAFGEAVPLGPDDVTNGADAEGQVEYRVVSVHSPPGFPTRVFFTRAFITPDGVRLNGVRSRKLRVATVHAFRRRIKGWPVPYTIAAAGGET